jgi:hypothetical protein
VLTYGWDNDVDRTAGVLVGFDTNRAQGTVGQLGVVTKTTGFLNGVVIGPAASVAGLVFDGDSTSNGGESTIYAIDHTSTALPVPLRLFGTQVRIDNDDAGSESAPLLTFTGDNDTGFFTAGANTLAITTGGTQRFTYSATSQTNTVPLLESAGSSSAPSFSFSGDTDTGLYSSAANVLGVAGSALELTLSGAGSKVRINGTPVSGDCTLDGAATATCTDTVPTNTVCVCSDSQPSTNGVAAIACANSAGTLTATSSVTNDTSVVSYVCL